jgi:hypothetical protein
MQSKWYFLLLGLIGGAFLWFPAADSQAWVRHNLMTNYALQGVSWLDEYDRISVTPYTYQDDSLNPGFKILYTNPDPAQITPPADKFVYYTLANYVKAGFGGAKIGQRVNARQILIDYSDEPDWDMDKQLNLSFAQNLMAGSQGYRHMYYPAGDWHLPYLFYPQGVAPDRAQHFYTLAKQAIQKNDLYWAFRFLARAVHYIEDMGQPYHTTQTSLRFITPPSPIAGTTQATKNYHFAYESYVAYCLQQEAGGLIPADYTQALKGAPAMKAKNVAQLLKEMARSNNGRVSETFKASVTLFGSKLRSGREVPLTQTEADSMLTSPQREQFDRTVRQAFELTAAGVRGFMGYVQRELLGGDRESEVRIQESGVRR